MISNKKASGLALVSSYAPKLPSYLSSYRYDIGIDIISSVHVWYSSLIIQL
jgi:hypothetical protein